MPHPPTAHKALRSPAPQAGGRGGEGAARRGVTGKRRVVILADKPKAELDAAVAEALRCVQRVLWEAEGLG